MNEKQAIKWDNLSIDTASYMKDKNKYAKNEIVLP
jgi:hypothetical protein